MSSVLAKEQAKLALVVDDSAMQCKVLSVLLKEEGYKVLTANDGARGVAMYIKYQPDLVLMDINMPIMNGYEAARKIKALNKENNLCPLIFITSMDSDKAFIESIEAGGDGILVRPFSPEVFKAKIKSIQRISDLYGQVKELQQAQQKDAELAEQLMSGVIESRNYATDKIGILKRAATLFSGDIQLSALSPNGDVNVMLGDFTGHGLRSSIGAIPLAETFRAMTKKGFSLTEIISQINQQMFYLLPPDLFLAACYARVSHHDGSIYFFNAGLPTTYVFNSLGDIKHKVDSMHPPMGVLPELIADIGLAVYTVSGGDRAIMISDGIVEARNEQDEMFGFERFEQAAMSAIKGQETNVGEFVFTQVNKFCQNMPQEDDISLIDIPCSGWEQVFVVNPIEGADQSFKYADISEVAAWQWNLMLTGNRLANVNPIPMAMNQIQEIEGSAEHWQSLFTILTELYVNALDHGVLGLSSEMKSSPDGFAQYFTEREERLKALNQGLIDISLHYYPFSSGGRVVVRIKDSGQGFDFNSYQLRLQEKVAFDSTSPQQLSGRGINLVFQLCESLEYRNNGSEVQASYIWKD